MTIETVTASEAIGKRPRPLLITGLSLSLLVLAIALMASLIYGAADISLKQFKIQNSKFTQEEIY